MDKSILRKFAIESRQELMSKIKNKIQTFYIDEDFSKEQKGEVYVLSNEKHSLSLTKEEYEKRELLIKRIKELSFEQVVEESAYTWFNRIIAIRYMETNDMLPLTKDNLSLGIRVLSSKDNTPDPEILKFSNLTNPDLDIELKKEKYIELKTDNEKFKYVLLLVCKKLGKVIPQVFDGVTDYIDILIPDNLLNDTGFITKVIKEVPEDNFKQVEIIGWLYQYYNQAEKDRVMSLKSVLKKNEIAYATQLFTPDWIVKYMVENSLGRYWIENNFDNYFDESWKYLIKEDIEKKKNVLKPQDITFIDPCCGSGHILVYAFEVFYKIYLQAGYNKNEISELILKHNLFGLDIDDRAGQLSILSVLLKAREYDKYIFNKNIARNINIMSIQESNNISELVIQNLTDKDNQNNALYLLDIFTNAKEIGSLLIVEKKDYSYLEKAIDEDNTIFGIELREKLLPLIKQARILSDKYDVIVTNPPYLGVSKMSDISKKYISKHYPDSKTDLFAVFLEKNFNKPFGYKAMINQQTWMFLNSYENLRKKIILEKNIISMIQLGTRAFEEIGGEIVQTTTFVIQETPPTKANGKYYRLVDIDDCKGKEKYFLDNKSNYYEINQEEFLNMPNYIIGYWMSDKIKKSFENIKLKEIAEAKSGIMTGDDNKFVKEWYEVNFQNISFDCTDYSYMSKKWYPITRGGLYRKWYGNLECVIDLENDAYGIKNNGKNYRLRENKYYFKPGITWTMITTKNLSVRIVPKGVIFGNGGPTVFLNNNLYYYLALLNSNIINKMISFMNPTMNIVIDDIENLPIIKADIEEIEKLSKCCVDISKKEWDSFETSWEFRKHPLIPSFDGIYDVIDGKFENKHSWISGIYDSWAEYTEQQFNKLKEIEEKLNNIFIINYGLEDELSSEVEDKDISIRKADKKREIKSLISYAVGCMFGRYSLDEDSLVFAGGKFDINRYKTYKADVDNIIPITDEAYFADDIVGKFKKFIEIVYGVDTLNDNLDFIAETLGKKGTETSEETIRRYFNNEFYVDHLKMYQKKPIYWMFESGKKNGFKCLVYIHRYNEGLVPKIRLDYLHRIQTTYEKLLSDIGYKLTTELSMNDKKEAQKLQAELSAKLQETKEYDEKIAHIANQKININLDDGVSINYDKFKDILAKLK